MRATDEFDRITRNLNVSDETISTLIQAEATFELAAAHRDLCKTIEEGIMYLVRNWPQP